MYTGRIVDIKKETFDTNQFIIELLGVKQFEFKPGQFVSFQLPIHENPKKALRHYSIASSPFENKLKFIINKVEGGLGTSFLFEKAKIGTEFPILGPVGKFILPEIIDRDLVMISTGTGIAPFRSMLNYIYEKKIQHKKIHLIFGSKKKDNLLYHDEFKAMAKKQESLEYHVALSRENFNGFQGYVHSIYRDLYRNRQNAHFYLCGFKQMIMDARSWLQENNYNRNYIHFEIYD